MKMTLYMKKVDRNATKKTKAPLKLIKENKRNTLQNLLGINALVTRHEEELLVVRKFLSLECTMIVRMKNELGCL